MMMNSIISFHSYCIFNGAIAVGYIISRFLLGLPFFKENLLQIQRLKFVRSFFISTIALFFLVPIILVMLPSTYHSSFQLGPILKSASVTFLQHHKINNEQITQIESTQSYFSMSIILMMMFLIGVVGLLGKYIKNLIVLKNIQQNSFCRHKINNIHMLFTHATEIPFCWSFLKNHFVAIPHAFLEKTNDIKLAIRHELQHIRQGDTYWLHFLTVIKSCCFWNPFVTLWMNWFDELQEFSCDEAIIFRNKIVSVAYAQCLLNVASDTLEKGWVPQGTLGIHGLSKSILYRRVNMLFNYNKSRTKKLSLIFVYVIAFFAAISAAYAFNGSSSMAPLTAQQVASIIKQSHFDKSFQISATPEVVSEINNIRSSDQARSFMHESLQRMKKYQPFIQEALKKQAMPTDLLGVPLVESGYQPLDQNKNPVLAAGIWQIIPSTARRFGLVVNEKRDDRLDTPLSTQAALAYLHVLHEQFNNWKLAFIAYEIGEDKTAQLIKLSGSKDAWVLARSSVAPESLKKTIAMFDAELIILHNPALIN